MSSSVSTSCPVMFFFRSEVVEPDYVAWNFVSICNLYILWSVPDCSQIFYFAKDSQTSIRMGKREGQQVVQCTQHVAEFRCDSTPVVSGT